MTQQQIPRPAPNPMPSWPAKRPRNTKLLAAWVTIAAVVLGGLLYAAWPYLKPAPDLPTTYTVIYEADSVGTAAGSITLEAPTGTQQEEVGLPLKSQAGDTGLTFSFQPGAFVYLSVQNHNDSGSVTCRITVKAVTGGYEVSRVISEVTSTGGHVIASCKGQVPR